jgi:hypothetical protein
MIVARGLGRGSHGQLLVTLGLGLDSGAVTPPPSGHGRRAGSRGFLPEKRKRRDTDDDVLILIL